MSKIDVVRAAMVEAMKAKDKARKDSLSMLLSALKNAEIDKREPLTEAEENSIVKRKSNRPRKPTTWLRLTVRISGERRPPAWLCTGNLHRLT